MKLEGKVAIVTGSTKGIGKGIATEFFKEGAKVVISSRKEAEAKAFAAELDPTGEKAIGIRCDVTSVDDIKALIAGTVEKFGKIDILVNNAGYHNSKGIEDNMSDEEFDFILKTNLYSMYYCVKYALPYLKETKGNIISTSSMVAKNGQAHSCAYTTSKAGQLGMTKNLAMDLAKYGIRVNVICPGWIESPLVDEWFEAQEDPEASRNYVYTSHPLGRIGTPTDCGRACVFLASDADAGFLTGVEIDVEGAITFGY